MHSTIKILLLVYLTLSSQQALAQIKFGSTITLSGSAAYLGKNAQEGMELARAEVNAAGGILGQPLEIIYEDFGEVDLKRAASAAQKLISIDKVTALLPMITEDAEVIYPLAYKKKLITMAIYAGAPDLTRRRPLFYQISSSDEVQMRVLADYAKSKGIKNACVIAENTAYPISIERSAREYWESQVGTQLLLLEYDPGTGDFKPYILKARAAGCEALFLLTSPNTQGTALRQISELRWNVLKLGFDWSEDENILNAAGSSSEGLIYAKYLLGTPDFIARYKKQYGREPGVPAALAYDAVRLLSQIIAREGRSTDKIDAALRSLHGYAGASGKVEFDEGTRREREARLWIFKRGKGQLLSEP